MAKNSEAMGYFMQDDDCHWYLVPVGESAKFLDLLDRMNGSSSNRDRLIDDFNERFSEYRLSGGVESLKVPMSCRG